MALSVPNSEIQAILKDAQKRRKEHLDAAKKIEESVFQKYSIDPDTLLPKNYTDMSRSPLAVMVLDYAGKHDGKVSVAEVMKIFAAKKVRCSPYVLLTRMVKAQRLKRTGRGLYQVA
jgi:hypothetical protein